MFKVVQSTTQVILEYPKFRDKNETYTNPNIMSKKIGVLQSCNNGEHIWDVGVKYKISDDKMLKACRVGFHTCIYYPIWMPPFQGRVFICEVEEPLRNYIHHGFSKNWKLVSRTCKLITRISQKDANRIIRSWLKIDIMLIKRNTTMMDIRRRLINGELVTDKSRKYYNETLSRYNLQSAQNIQFVFKNYLTHKENKTLAQWRKQLNESLQL